MSTKLFDVVLGNPPYQIEGTGGNTRGEPVYHHFIDAAYSMGNKVILITPGRFLFNVGQTPALWNEKMLNDPHLKVLFYEPNSSKVFSNTEIKGGVVITYRDADKNFGAIKTFVPHEKLKTTLNKVLSSPDFSSLSRVVYSSMSYRFSKKLFFDFPSALTALSGDTIRTNAFNSLPALFHDYRPDDGKEYVQIFGRQNNIRSYKWILKDYISDHENLNKFKVFVAKSNGSGKFGESLSEMIFGAPYCGHTQSFVSIGAFNTDTEAYNALKYIKTKFARSLLGVKKVTQDNQKSTWEFVPVQVFSSDSSINWSQPISIIDQQLFAKYGLDWEEIQFIESNVEEME